MSSYLIKYKTTIESDNRACQTPVVNQDKKFMDIVIYETDNTKNRGNENEHPRVFPVLASKQEASSGLILVKSTFYDQPL